MRARLPQLAIRPVLGLLADRTIRPVRLAPQRALPVAGLPQQVVPLDLLVVRRLEQIDVRRHVVARVVVDVVDQPFLPREPDDRRQERLRDAVGDVDALRVAPLGHDVAVAGDEAARRPRSLIGPMSVSNGSLPKLFFRNSAMSCVPGVSSAIASCTASARAPSHADFFGFLVLPVEALGKVGLCRRDDASLRIRRRIYRRARLRASALRQCRRDHQRRENDRERTFQHERAPCETAV